MIKNFDIDEKEERLVLERYRELKDERRKYIPRWNDIRDYVSITNEINTEFEDYKSPAEPKDLYINDPTGFICTNQAGDYLAGILWSKNAITIKPSDYIDKVSKGSDLSEFYKKVTEKTLEQINSTDAGFQSILKSYCYDQFSFATSGIGAFRSKEFDNGQSECCLSYKSYGVYNSCIDEGASNKINVIYTCYNWRLNKIVEEFCVTNGFFDNKALDDMPDEIKKAYEAGRFNQKFKLVYGVLPNNFYRMDKRGKLGAKFKGYWFLENSKQIFKVDYYKELPIAICRFIRVNGQVYGESSGSLAISSIKILNHVTGDTIDNIEKRNDAPLGVVSGALVAGNMLNRSAGSVTVFNSQATSGQQAPIFPISQAGDISSVINFLIPQLKKDITNIFKIDQLLDFNTKTQMTATESSYRMSIRGKSINGILSQQKTECIEPIIHRSVSIIQECGLYGVSLENMPERTPEEILRKQMAIKENDFIPDVVAQAMKDNKPWYKIEFNGELERLCNAEIYEAIGRFLQYFSAILNIKPEIAYAINAYEFLELLKSVSNLVNDNLVKTKTEYEQIIAAMEEAKAKQAQMQQALLQSQTGKNIAVMGKDEASANVIRSQY